MGQAILCRFHGATATKPARVTAKAWGGSATVTYGLRGRDADDPYRDAALALCEKMNWPGAELVGGTLPNGRDRVFVFCPAHARAKQARERTE